MIYEGSCHDEIGSSLVQRLMEASETELNHTSSRFLCLGLGLLYLGRNENADVMLEAVRTVEHRYTVSCLIHVLHIIYVYIYYICYTNYIVLLLYILLSLMILSYILHSRGKYAEITLDTCARCGSGKYNCIDHTYMSYVLYLILLYTYFTPLVICMICVLLYLSYYTHYYII